MREGEGEKEKERVRDEIENERGREIEEEKDGVKERWKETDILTRWRIEKERER